MSQSESQQTDRGTIALTLYLAHRDWQMTDRDEENLPMRERMPTWQAPYWERLADAVIALWNDRGATMTQPRTRARTYVTVIQAPEGYQSDSELRTLEETPAPPVMHAVVLLDDHEKLEAENKRLREALREAASGLAIASQHFTRRDQRLADEFADRAYAAAKTGFQEPPR